MIEVVIFELGGALVQLESLDARAYAQAVLALRPELLEGEVAARCAQLAGLSRRSLALQLVQQYGLEPAALAHAGGLAVTTSWQALLRLRAQAFERLLMSPEAIGGAAWPHRTALLYTARRMGCRIALVADASRRQTGAVLGALALADSFDLVLAGDDAEHGAADPALYLAAASELEVRPAACLTVSRTLLGARAALEAGMVVLAAAPAAARRQFIPFEACSRCLIVDRAAALPEHLYVQIAARQPDGPPAGA